MKRRIGFVDNCLDNFHANVYLEAIRGPLVDRGYYLAGAYALSPESSVEWCKEKDVTYFDELEKLSEQVDCFAILAPSNPELHLELCQRVFPFKKPTFVDKTFAPDWKTAEAIFQLADECGIAVQSTSALRTTNVQSFLADSPTTLRSMFITAAGPTFEEYGIHPVELAISCLGPEVEEVARFGSADHPRFLLKFTSERTAVIDFSGNADIPFSATLISETSCDHLIVDMETLFVDAAAAILDFFDAGKELIDRRETLMVRRVLDLAGSSELEGRFAKVGQLISDGKAMKAPHWGKQNVSIQSGH